MNTLRKLRARAIGPATLVAEACLGAVGIPSPSALLLLGHMRSGSTLLLHLLMSNPEVSALGERNAIYASRTDFSRLAIATRVAHGVPLRRLRYVVDQINHNHLTPNARLLRHSRVRGLFLLRQPQATVVSILELYRAFYPERNSVAGAVDYYVERLRCLMKLADALRSTSCAAFLSYETLTESPQETLEALRSFLQLGQGFSQTYKTYSFTRKRGDPGPRIAAGRILAEQANPRIQLPASELARARNAYVQCSDALARFALLPPSR
jgi:Sulfotransferase domain